MYSNAMCRRRRTHDAPFRTARLQELLHGALDGLFRDEVLDPCLAALRIVRVELGGGTATVHCQCATAQPFTMTALARVTPFLRVRLSQLLPLKRTPQLRFVFISARTGTEEG